MFITPEELDAQLEDLAHYMEYHDLIGQAEEIRSWEKKETKMEIPTEEIIVKLKTSINDAADTLRYRLDLKLLIEAQAREIRELQATICRLKEERVKI